MGMGCPSFHAWKGGKVLVWDTTYLVSSYCTLATREASAMAEEPEIRKRTKYANLEENYHLMPVAVETLGVFGLEAYSFLQELGRCKEDSMQDLLYHHYLR